MQPVRPTRRASTACPTEAMYKRPDGIVDFDKEICIGCKACMAACPYDAIFINPDDHSAEKCNFCAHRIDVGLEPACVVGVPDRSDHRRRLQRPDLEGRAASWRATRRRSDGPRRRRGRSVFYLGAHQATLDPLAAARPEGGLYMWASRAQPTPQHVIAGHPHGATVVGGGTALLRHPPPCAMGLAGQPLHVDQEHRRRRVPGGRAARADRSARLVGRGHCDGSAPVSALVFLGITGVLLIWDLEAPARFYLIFTRPQWRSWLVKGAFIIGGYGGIVVLYLAASVLGVRVGQQVLGVLGIAARPR